MARNRNTKISTRNTNRMREVTTFSSLSRLRSDPLTFRPPSYDLLGTPSVLSEIEDNRRFTFHRPHQHFSIIASPSRVRSTSQTSNFNSPVIPTLYKRTAVVCQRRQRRREVLFALRRSGRGIGKRLLKKAVWSGLSYLFCRRR